MESAQGYEPWFMGVRIFSGVPFRRKQQFHFNESVLVQIQFCRLRQIAQMVERFNYPSRKYAEMAESGLWHLPRKQTIRKGPWVQILLSAPYLVPYTRERKAVRINRRASNPSQYLIRRAILRGTFEGWSNKVK